MVCGIAVRLTTIGNSNLDAVENPKRVVGNVAGLSCATFRRSANIKNGSVDRTHKSKGYKNAFEEEHDVEIKLLEKKSLSRIDWLDKADAGVCCYFIKGEAKLYRATSGPANFKIPSMIPSRFILILEGGDLKYPDTLPRSEKLGNNYHNLKTWNIIKNYRN
jgi:hypothetical protein